MLWSTWLISFLLSLGSASPTPRRRRQSTNTSALLADISIIKSHWGQITPYADNVDDYFGVEDIGLPDGCQIEQFHLLERHGSRFPTGAYDDGANDENFAEKVSNYTRANATAKFQGPLSFLNGYEYPLGDGLLISLGALQSFDAGLTFWQRYGRILYNASAGQLAYNASFPNGTARPKPVLRTTGQSRIQNTQINWGLGFFGPSFLETPNPEIENATSSFEVVIIPEGGTENNTLASYDSCTNYNIPEVGYLGDQILEKYLDVYLKEATARMQQYAPSGFTFTINDTYAMQSLCAYETNYLGYSDFCHLFTEDEWTGFEATLDIEYYYDYSFGNPTGRAQGIGYLQELLARLTHQYITSSNSSVNSTLTDNPTDFPLDQPFYADFSHDDIIISVLTAMSLDYIKDPPSITDYPPDPDRRFVLSHLTPFAAKLVTEVIGCSSADPDPVHEKRQYYTPTQYGYSVTNASHKYIRLRLNNGILPLNTIRGGACGNRTDGLCEMGDFLTSQADAYELSNYNFACFGNYTIEDTGSGMDYDGTISNGTKSS